MAGYYILSSLIGFLEVLLYLPEAKTSQHSSDYRQELTDLGHSSSYEDRIHSSHTCKTNKITRGTHVRRPSPRKYTGTFRYV